MSLSAVGGAGKYAITREKRKTNQEKKLFKPALRPVLPVCRPAMGQRGPVCGPVQAGFTAGQETEGSGLSAGWAGPEAG